MGCSGSVNEELIATPTPYPIRTAVVANDNTIGSDEPTPHVQGNGDDPEAAVDDLNTAIVLSPERADLYLQRAALWERLPDFAVAEADYSRAIAIDPGSAAAYAGRGNVIALTAEGDLNRYQSAMDDFNRATAIDPTLLPALLGRALVYAERAEFRGDPQDLTLAIEAIASVAEAQPDSRALALQVRLLALHGEVDAAEKSIADALDLLPRDASPEEHAVVEAARATIAVAVSDWETAVDAANAALRSDPSRWEAYRTLASAELGRRDAEAARAAADRLLAKVPNDGRGLYLRGLALTTLGQVGDARISLEAAGDELHNSPVYQAKIAEALQRLERRPLSTGATNGAAPALIGRG
jgi:tetratricopeptide (TPR) repeat protein